MVVVYSGDPGSSSANNSNDITIITIDTITNAAATIITTSVF